MRGKKIGILPSFLQALGIFLSNAWLQTGTSYTHAILTFKIQMFILIHLTNLAAQITATAKQYYEKIPSTKIP